MLLCLSVAVTEVLGHPDSEVVANYGPTPTIDGTISLGEWDDAATVPFNETTVYVMHDGVNLYVAFDVSDSTYSVGDSCAIYFDVEHQGGTSLESDDIRLIVKRDGSLIEHEATYFGDPTNDWFWTAATVSGWTANLSSNTVWQVEYNITYSKINVTPDTAKTLGVEFESFDYRATPPGITSIWPYSTDPDYHKKPILWGDMIGEYDWVPEFSNLWILVIVFTAALPILLYFRARKKLYK